MMLYYITLCHFFAAISPNMVVGQIFSGLTFSLLQLFSGLFIPVGDMGGWSFMYYIVGTSYSLKFMALPQFASTAPTIQYTGSIYVSPAAVASAAFGGAGQQDVWPSFGYLIAIIVIFRFFAFCAYRWINFTKR